MAASIRQRSATLQNFVGGLNNFWDQSAIADNELASLINFEVTTNGALSSRPPIWQEYDESGAIYTPAENEPIDIIGTYIKNDGTRNLVVVTDDKTWIYNVEAKTWTQIATFRASDCTQFQNKVVLASLVEGEGGYWEAGTFTNTPTMPALGGIELFQNRFFGYGVQGTNTANTLYWSDLTTAGVEGEGNSIWDWQDEQGFFYVDIGDGDGQWITAIDQGYNDIVIFRNKSTYRYSYGAVPEEGTMQAMQQDIGAESKRSVVKFENAHFVLSGGTLYKYQNWLYYPLNAERVRFTPRDDFQSRFEYAISVIGRRCLVWFNGSIYSYSFDTNSWSEWVVPSAAGYFIEVPRKDQDPESALYFGISASTEIIQGTSDYGLWRIRAEVKPNSTESEEIRCSLRTKIYDFLTPVEWKRLYFWAVDVAAANEIEAVAYPVLVPSQEANPTWDEISKESELDSFFKTWDELSFDGEADVSFGTWDNITQPTYAVPTLLQMPFENKVTRAELKLNNSLRFRRIYFELYFNSDGTFNTSPVQVFSIIPMVGLKAKIAQGVN